MASLFALLAPIGAASAHESWFVTRLSRDDRWHQNTSAILGRVTGVQLVVNPRSNTERARLTEQVRESLYIRGQTVATEGKLQPDSYVCLGFRDHIVRRLEFDDHKDHEKDWNDADDCAC